MPRVYFSFTIGGMDAAYAGTPFVADDDAFDETVAKGNGVLASIEGADETETAYGIALPRVDRPYQIKKIFIQADGQDRVDLGMWNGSELVTPLASGAGMGDTGPYRSTIEWANGGGITVKTGYIPALVHGDGEGGDALVVSGYIDWEE